MLNEFIWPAEVEKMIKDQKKKEKRKFGPILNIHFLLGWRIRHKAKSVTNNLPIALMIKA
jgi:hypothetical protein